MATPISASEFLAPRGVIDAAARERLCLFDVGPRGQFPGPVLLPYAAPTGILTGYSFPPVRRGDTVVSPRQRVGLSRGTLLTAVTMIVRYNGLPVVGVPDRTVTLNPTAQGALTNAGTPTTDGFVTVGYTFAFSPTETVNFPNGQLLTYVITGTDSLNIFTCEIGTWFVIWADS